MSSIKDKPLKKIVCDTRVRIDTLHCDKINSINKNNNDKKKIINEINNLESKKNNTDNINLKIEIDNNIIFLKNKLQKYDKDEYTEYYLDNAYYYLIIIIKLMIIIKMIIIIMNKYQIKKNQF
jgi:hypothetical protein